MSGRRYLIGWLTVVLTVLSSACDGGSPTSPVVSSPVDVCTGFSDWQSSAYVLPYPPGEGYRVNQGNCSGFGHSGFWKYGYDFVMPIGTLITAARAGIALHSVGTAHDGDRSRINLVTIQHDDGTVMVYSHLTFGGALVEVGARVEAGDPIARSGDTGPTGDLPHLHFSLHPCGILPGMPDGDAVSCPTLPMNFSNTDPNPQGLIAGRTYIAKTY